MPNLSSANQTIAPYGPGHRELVSVEQVDPKPVQCIRVATGDGLYVTDDFIVTHNSRQAGGQVSVANYLKTLKAAAHERGLHISKRVVWIEGFLNEFSTMLRMLENLDAEDRAYHDLTPDKILEWASGKITEFHAMDQKWHKERGKVYVGKL